MNCRCFRSQQTSAATIMKCIGTEKGVDRICSDDKAFNTEKFTSAEPKVRDLAYHSRPLSVTCISPGETAKNPRPLSQQADFKSVACHPDVFMGLQSPKRRHGNHASVFTTLSQSQNEPAHPGFVQTVCTEFPTSPGSRPIASQYPGEGFQQNPPSPWEPMGP
ncbi:hypothetical protein ElyMa_005176700 [Elysia marginata]|uniref:Uncharacterized protein n=1 Tax=Elysia marginata TaxID=1093978 RepID=A0AAV4JUI2_9GAST|nr:hypothetical protein ElyMa_005176700 [Elysia marginata]